LLASLRKTEEDEMATEILNEREVHGDYGLTVPYLRRARRERRGPRFLKVGKLVRYRRIDVEAYLAAHAVETRDPEKPRGGSAVA
jgi:predicted DNA-binding transcriptional regulator AlpA